MLPTTFQVNWPFCSGQEPKKRFSKWQPFRISDRNNLSIFDLEVTPMLFTKFQDNWHFGSGGEAKKKKKKKFFKMAAVAAILDFRL